MTTTIQQLEDLKEWSKDSTRYERRLAFRNQSMPGGLGTEAGTIPLEFDELSDREIEYYRTGPWSTREDYSKGQLVQPGPGRQGYAGKPQESTTTSWKKKYKIKAFDEVADLFLKTYAEDDIDHIYKVARKLDDKMRFVSNDSELLQYISKQSGLSENQISNMLEDKVAHADLMADIKTQEGKAHHMKGKKKLDTRMKNWLMKNSEKYADPDRFKKSFARVFGKNNYILKGIKADKRAASMLPLGDDFIKTFISDKIKNPVDHSFSSQQLDDMFKSLIYNNNKTVNAKVRKTFLDLIPESRVSKGEHIDIYRALKDNKFLRKFAINEGLTGPIGRVIMKDLGDDLSKKIKLFQKPYMGTYDLINYLENHVDDAYKPMFKEAKQAVSSAQMNKWPDAKKHLDEGLTIMWDHKIPSSLIEAGYADDLEFIKANPTSKEFNINIKNKQFDKPMNKLVRQFEQAKTLDEKVNIHTKMVAKKDAFSKKYGNYLDEVKITMDKKGKLKFASDAPVVTKETDVVKMLKTSLGQEKFPTMNKTQQSKFIDNIYKSYRANGIGKNCPIKKAEGGRIGYFKGGSDQCMRNAIQEHKRKLADGNEAAIKKQMKINQTKGLKNMFTMGRKGLQSIISGVGLNQPGALALEAAIEAAFYGYGRQEGESHEQARENLFFPKIMAKYAPGLWEELGFKPFKTGVWEGPEKLIEEELIGTRWDPSGKVNRAAEYADGMKALEDEYATASKIDFELGILNNQWRPGSEEQIEAKEQELRDSYDRIEELQINIKEGTPAHDAYVAAQEKQKALRDERAQKHWGDTRAYKKGKERQWQEEFLDYRGADRKYRKEQPFAFKGGIEANIGPGEGQHIPWEEYFSRSIEDPRTTEQQKWNYIYNQGGFDLMDRIGIAGGVANMAGGGIAGIRRPGYSGGLLVKLAKLLKGAGKKKDLYKHIDMEKLMKGDKPIKVYSGTMDRQTNTWKSFKESAKDFDVTPEKYAKDQFKDQWFTPFKDYADSFSSPKYLESKLRSVDLTPKEIKLAKRYVEKINKKDMLVSMRRKKGIKPYPKHHVTTDENLVLIPRYKLKELEKTKRMKTDYMILEKLKKKIGLAEGGLTNIRRPWAIPPESGPDPQGLASMNNYVIKRTG